MYYETSDPDEVTRLVRELRRDASGEDGRISSTDAYRAAELLAELDAARAREQRMREALTTMVEHVCEHKCGDVGCLAQAVARTALAEGEGQ